MKRFTRMISLVLVLCMVFSLLPMAFAAEKYDEIGSGKTVILHSNDVHGEITGYAYMKALKTKLEAAGAEVILADAGDYSQGETSVSLTKGANAVDMMNVVGYDVVTLGNHEFDYGYPQLVENMNKANFKVLCADVLKEDGTPIFDANTIIEKGGVKIGFFGLETPETQTKANPALIKGLTFLTESTETTIWENAQTQVNALKASGADIVVCLAHLGVDASSEPYRSYDLYSKVTGIDFIIDGHSHTVMEKGDKGEPIQSTGTKFANIGVIVIDNATKKIEANYLVATGENGFNEKDETVLAKAQGILDAIKAEYGVKFATSEVELNGAKEPGNRTEETNNGDLITDAMVWYLTEKNPGSITETPAENILAITNGGGIRASVKKGDVTKNDIFTVLPFGNTVAVVYVTGAELLEALEASTYCTPISLGGFPQVAGLKFTVDADVAYDKNPETYPGSTYYGPASIKRVTIDEINGKPFDATAKYAVITNNFVAGGGDTYYAFAAASSQFDTGYTLDSVVIDYITEKLGGVITEADYGAPKGRITVKYTEQATDKITIGGLDADIWMTKYGNVYTDCKAVDFFDKLGFTWGDIVTVKFLDKTLELPVVPTYHYVDSGKPAIIVNKDENGLPTGFLSMAINMGNFATTYGIAEKHTNEDKTWYWTAMEGVTFPIEVTFEMKEKGGYMAEYLLHDLNRTNNREDYADLTDEQFANFRNIATTGMGKNILYRSSSPVNPEIGRNTYADKAAEAAGVKTFMNLADNKAAAEAYEGYADSYYSKQDVAFLGLGVDFSEASFKEGLAEGLRFMTTHEGPYLVHCTEGKDRAGYVSALLECFMGATYEEVCADYMTTYENYYGVEKGSEKYTAILNSNIVKSLKNAFGVEDLAAADLKAEATEYLKEIGLSDAEIEQLRKNLSVARFELVPDSSNMFKYGHLDLNVSTEEFLKIFEYGDIVTVTFNGKSYDFPVCSNYDDVDTHALLIRAATGKNVVTLAINYGQIGVEAGIIEKAPEGASSKYQIKEGVTFPIYATVTLKEAGGYKDELSVRQLNRTNNREEYPDLTDEQFANFRNIATTGMGKNVLYRSSSPINPELGRNTYADKAAEAAGIKTFVNLADSEEEAKGYEGFGESYYAKQNVIFLGLPVAFTTKEFKDGLAEGFRYMTKNEGPYLVHCTEGKDRAGLTAAILECFMGASAEEVANDYLTTFRNYYNVVGGKQNALTEAQEAYLKNVILKNLCLIFDMEDATKADLKAEAAAYLKEIGLSDAEIEQLRKNLSGAPVANPFTDVKEGAWYYDYVLDMTDKGIIKGMTPTTFEPEGTLTRGQVATLLYRMAGEPEVTGKTTFTDVPEKAWYATAIAWAQQEKIVNGTSETTFEPEGAVTRAQLVTMLYRMAGEPEVKEAATFKDLKADWYKNAVAWAEDMKVVNGTTETTFEPEGLCTRAQAAKILSIYMTLK